MMTELERIALQMRTGEYEAKRKERMQGIAEAEAVKQASAERRRGGLKALTTIGAVGGGLLAAPLTGGASLAATLAILAGTSAGGAALGELARQNIVRNDDEGIDVGEIAKEAGVSGALSAGTLGLGKAIQGARAGMTVPQLLGSTSDDITRAAQAAQAAKQTAKQTASQGGKLATKGTRLKGDVRGIKPGTKIDGRTLGDKGSKELNKFLDDIGIKKGEAADQLAELEKFKSTQLSRLTDTINKNNAKLVKGDVATLQGNFAKKLSQKIGVDINDDAAREVAGRFSKLRSLKQTDSLRKELDEVINFARNPNTADPVKERIYRAARETLDDFTTQKLPAGKTIKTTLSRVYKAEDALTQATKTRQGVNILNNKIGNRPAAQAKMIIGNTLERQGGGLGTALANVGGNVGTAITPSTVPRAVAGSQLLQALLGGDENEKEPNDMVGQAIADVQTTDQTFGMGGQFSQPNTLASALGNPEIQQQLLLADLLDPNSQGGNIGALQAIFELSTPQVPVDPLEYLNVGERGALNDIQAAEGLVDQLERNVEEVGLGSGLGRFVEGPKDFIGAKLQTNDAAAAFEQSRGALATLLIRAIGEKGTLAEGDVNRALNLIPRITDNRETAARKLQDLRNIFTQRKTTLLETAQRAEGQGAGDLQSALMGAGVQL